MQSNLTTKLQLGRLIEELDAQASAMRKEIENHALGWHFAEAAALEKEYIKVSSRLQKLRKIIDPFSWERRSAVISATWRLGRTVRSDLGNRADELSEAELIANGLPPESAAQLMQELGALQPRQDFVTSTMIQEALQGIVLGKHSGLQLELRKDIHLQVTLDLNELIIQLSSTKALSRGSCIRELKVLGFERQTRETHSVSGKSMNTISYTKRVESVEAAIELIAITYFDALWQFGRRGRSDNLVVMGA